MLKWHGPGRKRLGPFNFRGGGLRGECLPARTVLAVDHAPHQYSYRLRVSTLPSFQNSAYSGQHGGSLPISGVVADQ